MKTPWKQFAFVVLISCSLTAMAGRSEDEAAIRDAVTRVNAAYNRQDAEAIAPLLAQDFETWDGIKGRRDVSLAWAAENTYYRKLGELGIRFISADVAIYRERGEAWDVASDDQSAPETTEFIESWILVRRNARWWPTAFFYYPIED